MRKGLFKLVLTGVLLGLAPAVTWMASGAQARDLAPSAVTDVALSSLPEQGRETYRLIHQGGPFPYEKDGTVFGNRERLLPGQKRGFYREYTVRTPDSKDRGARRIVCGGAATKPEICYYTANHYASFSRIVP